MTLTAYCTYDSIRAVLGVSNDELPDAVISQPIYLVMLTEDLAELSDTAASRYAEIVALVSPTAEQARYLTLVQTYAAYQVANRLLGAAPMFAPKDIGDNRTTLSRVADPFKALEESVQFSLNYIRTKLKALLVALYPTDSVAAASVARVMILGVGSATDPVTNA